MKRFLAILAAVALVLVLLASPALAASLGISPSHKELEVPGDGSATADFQVHYFSGDLKVSLVDIPLRVEPETIRIEPSGEPVDIEVTIYGDESLGSRVYNGYIRFLGMSGGTVAVAVKVKAKVNHIVAGQPLVEETPAEESPEQESPEEPLLEEAPAEKAPAPEETEATVEKAPAEAAKPPAPAPQAGIGDLPLSTVIIIAGGLVFIGLVALAISLIVRRRQY